MTHIRNLDVEGNNVLNETLEKKSFFIKELTKLSTYVKQYFGNLFFKRERILTEKWEGVEIFSEEILPKGCNLDQELEKFKKFPGGITLGCVDGEYVIRYLNVEKIKEQKEKIQYDDEIRGFGKIRYLQHQTTLTSLKKILSDGKLLPRNKMTEPEFGLGHGCDGDYVYTQAITNIWQRYQLNLSKKEILYDKKLTIKEREESDERVILILDRNLLKRKDYFAASGMWNYGPFGRPVYFGPEVRNVEKYNRVSKKDVISSVNDIVKKINQRWILPNEVGFQNPIDLKKCLVKIILPKQDEEIIDQLKNQGYKFPQEIKKTREHWSYSVKMFFLTKICRLK